MVLGGLKLVRLGVVFLGSFVFGIFLFFFFLFLGKVLVCMFYPRLSGLVNSVSLLVDKAFFTGTLLLGPLERKAVYCFAESKPRPCYGNLIAVPETAKNECW